MASGWGGWRPNSGRKKPGDKKKTDNGARPKAKPEAKPEPARPMDVDAVHQLIAMSRENSRKRPRTPDWNPYIIRPELFGPIAPHVAQNRPELTMAKDNALVQSNQVAVQAWQAGGLLGNAVSEGLLFLGYPYLSELAQRPEFRLFGEIRAEEMTRKWRKWRGTDDESTKEKARQQDEDDDRPNRKLRGTSDAIGGEEKKPRTDARNKEIETKIKELEDFEREMKVREWFKAAFAQDSFFGISHLFVDIKGGNLDDRNDPELKTDIGNGRDETSKLKLGKGCLRGLKVIEPIWIYPTTYNAQNPLAPDWYDPRVWYCMGTEVHKSRMLSFIGRPVPDILKPAYAFGGLSMTQMAQPYVDIWLRTRESVGQIIHAFSVMVLMTNMATRTMPGGAGGGPGDIMARMAIFNDLRDNQGLFLIDKATEDFKNISAPLSGLDDLQAQSQEHLFSVGRIPAVKFAGIQPKGLNATSEGEIRAFYDTITGEQNHLGRPNLTIIDDIMQISLWGQRDPDITSDFLPLWELTEKEKAEKRKMEAEVDQIYLDASVLSPEEIRTRVANDPESGYDGIDPDDVPDLLEEEEEGLEPQGGRPNPLAGKKPDEVDGKDPLGEGDDDE